MIDRGIRELCTTEPQLLLGPFRPDAGRGSRERFEDVLRPLAGAGAGILAVTGPSRPSGEGPAVGDLEESAAAIEACRRACAATDTLVAAALVPLDVSSPLAFGQAYIRYHAVVKGLAAAEPDLFWIVGSRDLVDLHAAAVAVRELWRGPAGASVPGPRDSSQPNTSWSAGAVILAGLGFDLIGLTADIDEGERALLARIAGLPAAAAAPRGVPLSETFRLAGAAATQGAGLFCPGPESCPEVIPALRGLIRRGRPSRAEAEPGPWLATPVSVHGPHEGEIDAALLLEAAHPDQLEAALRGYPGRPLVRVVAHDRIEREECVYICARYGAAVTVPLLSADPDASIAEATDWLAWAETYRLIDLRFERGPSEHARAVPHG
ncbi:MAG: hypothetical protein JXP34_23865 [Planctomycetes bacterium]|nr:hypothetical protein [Planctomycetota bacterium]